MKTKLESYSRCMAYDVLMQIKPLFNFDEKAIATVNSLLDYLGDELQVYTGEQLQNVESVVVTYDDNSDISDVQVLLPLLDN